MPDSQQITPPSADNNNNDSQHSPTVSHLDYTPSVSRSTYDPVSADPNQLPRRFPSAVTDNPHPPYASGALLPEQPAEDPVELYAASPRAEKGSAKIAELQAPIPSRHATNVGNQYDTTPAPQRSTSLRSNPVSESFPSPPPSVKQNEQAVPAPPSPQSQPAHHKTEEIHQLDASNIEPDGAAGYAMAMAAASGAQAGATAAQGPKKTWGERFSEFGQRTVSKIGAPGFLPQSLDKECEKAAQILKSFCKEGTYVDAPSTSTKGKSKDRVLVTIPSTVISRAVGLAIFTTLRAGAHLTGAMGSGLLVARLPDGTWSSPSAIQVLSMGGGLQIGIDVYDCVCVINTPEALAAFTNTRVSIGGDMAVAAGPYGVGSAVAVGSTMGGRDDDKKQSKKDGRAAAQDPASSLQPERPGLQSRLSSSSSALKPVFSYVKSRGLYGGVQVDGTVIVERKEANAAFYGTPVRVGQILRGDVPAQAGALPAGAWVLNEVLRGAETGRLQSQGSEVTVASVPAAPAETNPSAVPEAGPRDAVAAAAPVSAPDSAPAPAVGENITASIPKAAPASTPRDGPVDTAAVHEKGVDLDAEPPAYTGSPVDEPPPAYVEGGVERVDARDAKQSQQ